MRVAVIDCGTNTIRLLLAESFTPGRFLEVAREVRFCRLGEGVDASGRFEPAALERTLAAVEEFADLIAQFAPARVRFIATAVARDVANAADLFAGVQSRLGVLPEVISGEEEAELSFLGALAGAGNPGPGDLLVVDIGGGSTELIRGRASGEILASVSLNVGSRRLCERYLSGDPPSEQAIESARRFLASLLDQAPVWSAGLVGLIGVAGTITSLSAMSQGLETYDRARVHNSFLTQTTIGELSGGLLTLDRATIRQRYPSLQPPRVEVIASGALIAAAITQRSNLGMTVRETDILDGAAFRLLNTTSARILDKL